MSRPGLGGALDSEEQRAITCTQFALGFQGFKGRAAHTLGSSGALLGLGKVRRGAKTGCRSHTVGEPENWVTCMHQIQGCWELWWEALVQAVASLGAWCGQGYGKCRLEHDPCSLSTPPYSSFMGDTASRSRLQETQACHKSLLEPSPSSPLWQSTPRLPRSRSSPRCWMSLCWHQAKAGRRWGRAPCLGLGLMGTMWRCEALTIITQRSEVGGISVGLRRGQSGGHRLGVWWPQKFGSLRQGSEFGTAHCLGTRHGAGRWSLEASLAGLGDAWGPVVTEQCT